MAIHPRDHVLCLGFQGATSQTTLTNVTCSVRVNGGAATVYSSVTSPAIAQAQDCNFAYHLELPANSFNDGDRVSRTWLYSSVAQAYGDTIIGPAAVDGSHYTTGRGDNLANLDATVSSRSTYAGTDTAGTTTLLSRLTSTRAGYLDNLTNLDAAVSGVAAAVWAAATRTLTAVSDSSGVTTLLSRLTSGRATNLDNLDATVSSRLATTSYTAPDNTDIAAIKAKTDLITAGSVQVVSPVLTTGTISLVAGDDYKAADGRAITFTSTDWPSLAGATVHLHLGTGVNVTGSVSGTTASFDVTATQTATLTGSQEYAAIATLSDGDTVTLAQGTCVVTFNP